MFLKEFGQFFSALFFCLFPCFAFFLVFSHTDNYKIVVLVFARTVNPVRTLCKNVRCDEQKNQGKRYVLHHFFSCFLITTIF